MKSLLLVVLYNKRIKDSTTISSFLNKCRKYHPSIDLFIWDNTTKSDIRTDESILCDINYHYHKAGSNTPLSVVYNTVLNKYRDFDLLFNFDQDSILDEDYFDALFNSYNPLEDCALYCPLIYHNDLCVSPGIMGRYKADYWLKPDVGLQSSKDKLVITSGIVLDIKKIFNACLRYDENLILYGIDLKFSLDYAMCFPKICVFNYRLAHDLSIFDQSESRSKKIFRLVNGFKAELYIYRTTKKDIVFYLYSIIRFVHNYSRILLR